MNDPESGRDPVVDRAATAAGGIVRLSLALGLSRGAVSQWRQVPAERVLDVERITGITRYELRPDVFGEAPNGDVPIGAAANGELGGEHADPAGYEGPELRGLG